jgi:hemerythrin
MLPWSEQFETGQALIDAQHRMLISYVNQLEELAHHSHPDRVDVELFSRFIEFLETYITTHFRDEEECMLGFKCPFHEDNKLAHRAFLEFFRTFKLRLAAEGFHPEVVTELHEFCCSWIQSHILRVDVQIKPCLNQTPVPETEEVE